MEINNALGRRKTAIARVYLTAGTGQVTINKKDIKTYFASLTLQNAALKPFEVTNTMGQFDVTVHVNGGGTAGQAGAVSLGITRALVKYNAELKPALKASDLTTRDPRMVERKKPGQKKARKRFQFVKR
ncbi:MAG: 30S ribosomal protein S9 [Bacteroidetes bacterium]|jgi:small subunit ribosomal protein S9|nr:30S ribosomal protein S9 [Bacteroidota bacterium]